MPEQELRIRWAPKVRQDKIRRLYENDASGLLDEALVDDIGWALYLRAESLLMVATGRVKCPRCKTAFTCVPPMGKTQDVEAAPCPQCGWTTTRTQYHRSWAHADLNGINALSAFETFVSRYPAASTYRERVLLIDRLIHAFHHGLKNVGVPHRAAANNLIEGSHDNVVAFLDRLTYGEASNPEVVRTQEKWLELSARMMRVRKGRTGD